VRRVLVLALTLLVLPSAVLLAGTADGYRLAGIIAVGEDYLAVLELPGGEQVLVRRGSEIAGGGRIQLLDADRMRIALPDHVLDLALDRSLTAPVVPAGLGVVQEQTDDGNVLIRRVDPEAFGSSVAQSRAAARPAPGTPATGKRPDPAAEAGRRLAPILNLPPDSRIVAVNEHTVRSADQAVALIEQSLAAGVSPRLNITGAAGESRVYMSPATP
jgi:hypothetical protein